MCADFVEVFVDRILDESFRYNEVRVIFDRYIEGSLKAQTMVGRTRGYSTVFQVHDEIKTDNLKTKTFLPSIETNTIWQFSWGRKLLGRYKTGRFTTLLCPARFVIQIFQILILLSQATIQREQIQVLLTRDWCGSTKILSRSYNILLINRCSTDSNTIFFGLV